MKKPEFKPRMTFIDHNDPDNRFDTSKVIYQSNAMTLSEILLDFTNFLRSAGFCIKNNEVLDFVPEFSDDKGDE